MLSQEAFIAIVFGAFLFFFSFAFIPFFVCFCITHGELMDSIKDIREEHFKEKYGKRYLPVILQTLKEKGVLKDE